MEIDSYDTPEGEALLRATEERLARQRSQRRQFLTHTVAAAGFLAAAALIAAFGVRQRPLSASTVIIVLVTWALVERVKFPVAGGWARPTMLAFVPALFVLPTALAPLFAALAILLRRVPDLIRDPSRLPMVPVLIADGWFTIGPAIVILAGGADRFSWSHWPVYVGALLAQILVDLTATTARCAIGEGISPRVQLPLLGWMYALDAALAPVGLMIAAVAIERPGLMLLTLPMMLLFSLFARERAERMENTLALSTAYRGTALLLGDVIEDDDEYTGVHSRAVVDLAVAVAHRLGLDATQRRNVEFGALLHDVGKIRIPKEIIHKPGKLDDAEWALMRQHTVFGEQMLNQVGGTLSSVGKVVRHSHERYDGNGYPDALAGEAIPIEARIVCACDAFNAMTTNRPYRPAMTLEAAIAEMEQCSGSHFDPSVVYALLAEVAERPPVLPAARQAATIVGA